MNSGIKQRIIQLSKRKSLKPTDVAKGIGVSKQSLSAVMNETTPGHEIVRKLSAFFGVPVEYLTSGEAKEEPGRVVYQTTTDDLMTMLKAMSKKIDVLTAEIRKMRGHPSGVDLELEHIESALRG